MSDRTAAPGDAVDVLAIDDALARSTGTPGYGVTAEGFVPKPFARLLAEKLALARALFGDEIDLGSSSAVRKLLEIAALEDARSWAALAATYDGSFVVSATGDALSRLGEELGLPRPFLEAAGTVMLELTGDLPTGTTALEIPRGARMLTPGGHHAATTEAARFSGGDRRRQVGVAAFYPGPEHNLDPALKADDGRFPQRIDAFNRFDRKLEALTRLQDETGGSSDVKISHTQPLTGGQLQWPDARYRALLLRAPRSIWTADAIATAVSLVPGVRQVQVRDALGGLDVNESIFGNFNFMERVFASDRDLGNPYYLTVLVAPTRSAIQAGPDGLIASVESAIEDLRPISIFPRVELASEVSVGITASLAVSGLPLPMGSSTTVNASAVARTFKAQLLDRVRRYIEGLGFAEPVRAAEITWALMSEPGVLDVRDLTLRAYPPIRFDQVDFAQPAQAQVFRAGENVQLQANQVPILVDDPSGLVII
jgi:hypothetical protein